MVPFPDRFHGVPCRLSEIVDRAGVVIAGAGSVIDGNLDAVEADIFAGARRERSGADKDAAVATFADLEIEREDEVGPLLRVDKHVVAALVWVEAILLDLRSWRLHVAGHPTRGGLSIKEQPPARGLLFWREDVICRQDGRCEDKENADQVLRHKQFSDRWCSVGISEYREHCAPGRHSRLRECP